MASVLVMTIGEKTNDSWFIFKHNGDFLFLPINLYEKFNKYFIMYKLQILNRVELKK